jgi:TolA-binding protein
MIPSEVVHDLKRRRELREAMALALVPLGVAFVLGVLLLPRRALPDSVPLPIADPGELVRIAAADHLRAEDARRELLPGPVRALGTALRNFHTMEAAEGETHDLYRAKQAVDDALLAALGGGTEPLLELRAVELEGFLDEMHHFETTGEQSAELKALAGAFVRSLTTEGWCDGHTVAPGDDALRTMFKQMWNALLGVEGKAGLAPTLDEQRAVYAFYISHAHPPRAMREALDAARRGARDATACAAVAEAERAATESWRIERINRLGAVDPAYPTEYARGVASYRRGDFGASVRAFQTWLRDHPGGPLALRAQNYLRSAAAAERVE